MEMRQVNRHMTQWGPFPNTLAAMRPPRPSNATMLLAVASVLVGYGLFYLTDGPILFYAGCLFLTVVCGYHALSSLFRGTLNIGATIASQTMLWHALPFSYIGFFGYNNYIYEVSEIQNATSLIIVIIVATITYFYFSRFGRSISLRSVGVDWRDYFPLVVPILMIQTYLIVSGNRGYASVVGIASEGGGEREASLLYQFATGFSPAIMPMCAAALAMILRKHGSGRSIIGIFFCVAVLSVQFLWWTTAGRRYMTIIALISAVTFLAIYYRGRLNERRVVTITIVTLLTIPALWFLWESYYVLRLATDASRGAENLSILDLQRARGLAGGSDMQGQFIENIVRRPFLTLTSLSVVRETATGILWGWNITSQALLTIPSSMFPNKFEFIGPVLESLWSESLGVPIRDWTNTPFVEGYVDFNFFGFPILVMIISIISHIVFKIATYTEYSSVVSFSYFNISFFLLNTESTVNSIFVCFRSTLFIIIIALVVRFFRRRRPAKRFNPGFP